MLGYCGFVLAMGARVELKGLLSSLKFGPSIVSWKETMDLVRRRHPRPVKCQLIFVVLVPLKCNLN